MEAAERKALASVLKPGRYMWSMRLPAEAGTLCGKRIGFEIDTLLLGKKGETSLTTQEHRLIERILTCLPKLVRKAEKEWWAYHGDPDYAQNVSRPKVWISRDNQASVKRGQRAFVVCLRESSYAWHIEFSGTRFKQIWAGS